MPRCASCAKFAQVDSESEPEANLSVAADEKNARISGSVRIANACADCSGELQSAKFDVDVLVEVDHSAKCDEEEDPDFSLEESWERFDEFQPPKAKRQKHYYGAEAELTVTCDTCGATAVGHFKDSVQSSAMDEA